jgi:hypothetical protein
MDTVLLASMRSYLLSSNQFRYRVPTLNYNLTTALGSPHRLITSPCSSPPEVNPFFRSAYISYNPLNASTNIEDELVIPDHDRSV